MLEISWFDQIYRIVKFEKGLQMQEKWQNQLRFEFSVENQFDRFALLDIFRFYSGRLQIDT